jgi:uncharacterized protein
MPPIPALNPIFAERSSVVPPGCPPAPVPGADLSAPQRAALTALRAYKVLVSPMFAGSCRYLPSCSDYAAEAVTRFGVLRGSWLAAKRLARCQPFGGHGVDAVPRHRAKSR